MFYRNIRKSYIGLIFILALFMVGCSSNEVSEIESKPTGKVEAQDMDIRSKIPGNILTVNVEEGQEVKKGDLLYEIDPKDLNVKKAQAEAKASGAKAQLDKALSGARKQEIAQIEAVLEQAKAKETLLQNKYNRMYPLYEAEALPKDTLDELQTQLTAAKYDVKAVTEKLAMAREGARKEDIEALKAQYDGAMALLEEVKIHLEDTKVYAPMDGTVSTVLAKAGELIGQGTPVVSLINYKDRWVEANIDETEIVKLKIGDKVDLLSKAYPDKPFKGQIVSINQNPDFAIKKSTNELNEKDTITYAVKFKILEDERSLFPGMLLEIAFGNEE